MLDVFINRVDLIRQNIYNIVFQKGELMTTKDNVFVFTTLPNSAVKDQIGEEAFMARVLASQKAAQADAEAHYKLFALCEPTMMQHFQNLGIEFIIDGGMRMGHGRRLAGQVSVDYVRENGLHERNPAFIWREPEKEMAKFTALIAEPITSGRCDIVIPERITVNSYPDWCQHWERLISILASKIVGKNADYCFGPRGMSLGMMEHYFLRYPLRYPINAPNFPQLPDRHDCIFNPIMEAVRQGVALETVKVDFQYPQVQRVAEENDRETMRKRVRVLSELYSAMDNYDFWLNERAA